MQVASEIKLSNVRKPMKFRTSNRTNSDPTYNDERSWTYGAGTPFPELPLSEKQYDGDKAFDDCEPWVL